MTNKAPRYWLEERWGKKGNILEGWILLYGLGANCTKFHLEIAIHNLYVLTLIDSILMTLSHRSLEVGCCKVQINMNLSLYSS